MKFFIAGTMRGSIEGTDFVNQSYRQAIRSLIKLHYPDAEIYDPLEGCDISRSNEIEFQEGKKVFFKQAKKSKEVDVMIVYLPSASMGTAIEMWEAFHSGAIIITISTMKHNWVVRFLSHYLFSGITQFRDALEAGSLPLDG